MACPHCNDIGYIEDREHNELLRYCNCPIGQQVWRKQWEQKLLDAEIPSEFWTLRYDDFCPQPAFPEHINFMRMLESYLKNIQEHRKEGTIWLICGESGVGKTLGGAFILKQALKKDYSAHYAIWTNIVDSTLGEYDRSALDDLREKDFLVIDDLGSDKINVNTKSNYTADLLEKIIKPRYSNKLPTILISSHPFQELVTKYSILPRMIPLEWRTNVKGVSFRTNKINLRPPTK